MPFNYHHFRNQFGRAATYYGTRPLVEMVDKIPKKIEDVPEFLGNRAQLIEERRKKRRLERLSRYGDKRNKPRKLVKNLPQYSANMDVDMQTPTRRGRRNSNASFLFTPSSVRSAGYRPRVRVGTRRTRVQRSRYRVKKRMKKFRRRNFKKKKYFRKKKVIEKSRTHGYHKISEIYGEVKDPHCVYIHHATFHDEYLVETILGAIYRKLFKKAGIEIADQNAVIVGSSLTSAVGFKIAFEYQDPVVGTSTASEYPLVSTDTLDSLAGGTYADPRNFLFAYLRGTNDGEMQRFTLFQLDVTNVTPSVSEAWRCVAELNMQKEIMNISMTSVLRYQNRTLAVNGSTGTEADRVDCQPLAGKVYSFRHSDPRMKYQSNFPSYESTLCNVDSIGVGLIRATAEMPVNYQEPPHPSKWANLVGHYNVNVNPGEMRQAMVKYKVRGYFINAMKKFAGDRYTTSIYHGMSGRSQIIALEERIRTSSNNPVTVGYEREFRVGVWFETKKGISFMSNYEEGELNNVPS